MDEGKCRQRRTAPASPGRQERIEYLATHDVLTGLFSRAVVDQMVAHGIASATFALKAGVWFRRVRFVIIFPLFGGDHRRSQAENPLIPLSEFVRPPLAAQAQLRGAPSPNELSARHSLPPTSTVGEEP